MIFSFLFLPLSIYSDNYTMYAAIAPTPFMYPKQNNSDKIIQEHYCEK